ncbi:MAG: alpha/beta hydrolase, partial [Acidimicrobiales bacterium]
VVSATVATGRFNPLGRLVGDFLVQPASARGRTRQGRHIPFPDDHKRHFEGLHHFRLLNHPSVYEVMREWLEGASHFHPGDRSAPVGA